MKIFSPAPSFNQYQGPSISIASLALMLFLHEAIYLE